MQLLSVYRDYGVIPTNSRADNFNRPADDLSSYLYVRPGDLVLNKMKTWQGSLGVSEHEGIVSPAYYVCEISSRLHSRFAHYLLRSSPYISLYRAASKGIRPNQWDLPFEEFRKIPALLPSLNEQRCIADFLDAEMRTLDRLVAAMRRQLDTLAARRRSVLDLLWPMTSGAVTRIGYETSLVTSGPRGWGNFVTDSDFGALFFRSGNLQKFSLAPNLVNVARVAPPVVSAAEAARSRIRAGDVLIGITGANTGWVTLADDRLSGANISQHVCLVRPTEGRIESNWLALLLSSPRVQDELLASQYGGTKTQLSLPDIRSVRLPEIGLDEQRQVASDVSRKLEIIERQVQLRIAQISLLAERRQAIVTAAVTGQIDIATASAVTD